jgi:hypothetical protein
MLTKAMRKYVVRVDNSGYDKNKQSTYDGRVEGYVLQALKDLALLAERLPEKQLEKVFNAKTLTPFFHALFKLEIKGATHEEWLKEKESTEVKAKRDRLLKLAGASLSAIGNEKFARDLLPELLSPYVEGFPYIRNFEFIITQATR